MKSIYRLVVAAGMVLVFTACQAPNPGQTQDSTVASVAKNGATSPMSPADTDSGKSSSASSKSNSPSAKSDDSAPVTVVSPKSKPELLLTEGTELYDKGDYKGAIRKLQLASESADDTTSTKQDSLRLLAFSYCVTGQRALCKTQFSNLLKITPDFQLSRAEAGHPLWGPVFKEAKVAATPPSVAAAKPVKKP